MEQSKNIPDAANSHSIHSLNVEVLHESKKPKKNILESEHWYDELKYWILLGLIAMIPAVILGFFHKQFFLLIPLGPFVGFICWEIRRFIKLHNLDVNDKI